MEKNHPNLLIREAVLLDRLRDIQTRHIRKTDIRYIAKAEIQDRADINIDANANFVSALDPEELEDGSKELERIYNVLEKIDENYVDMRRGRPLTFDKIHNIL